MGYIGVTGGTFTIVSPLVPMTILVTAPRRWSTCTRASSIGRRSARVDEHQIFALANKFVACTASIFATAVGFAALAVSKIRPIREMGIWVAVGLVLTWVIVFTLFPALQKILRTPTRAGARGGAAAGSRASPSWLPRLDLPLALAAGRSARSCSRRVGAVALFGIPGVVAPMQLLTDPVEYIDHDSPLYRDTKRLEHA